MARPASSLASLLILSACVMAPEMPPGATPATPVVEPAAPETEPPAHPLPMHLVGGLDVGTGVIEYFARLEERDGEVSGTLSIPAQGARGVALSKVIVDDDVVSFALAEVGATWTGRFGDDGIECSFTQSGVSVPCTMETVTADVYAKKAAPGRPQDPKPPFPYDVEEAKFDSEGISIACTLTVPKGGPHRGVMLISGSGAQDRDEALVGHRPFLVLADHLSRNGTAVLRCDDRGVGESGGEVGKATMKNLARDVEAGVAYLVAHDRVDPKKVGLLGHSEGGAIGPYVAASNKNVAFVVTLAGPGVDGGEILVEQAGAIAKSVGADEATIKQAKDAQRKAMEILVATKDNAKARTELKKVLDPEGAGGAAIDKQLDVVTSPWFRTFVSYDPAPTLKKLKVPVLALFGSLDVQVVATQNAPAFKKALARNKKAKIETIEGCNHLFQQASTGSPAEYGQIDQTMDPAVLDKISSWLAAL